MSIYTVLLEDGTTGTIDDSTIYGQSPEAYIGEYLTVQLSDENGLPTTVNGKLVEVLEEES